MPAVFDSLVHSNNLTPKVAWRVAYIVPFVLITATALGMLLLCEDTPTGKWSDRHLAASSEPASPPSESSVPSSSNERGENGTKTPDVESVSNGNLAAVARGEVVVAPTLRSGLSVIFSPHSLALAIPYAFSFGTPTIPLFSYPAASLSLPPIC